MSEKVSWKTRMETFKALLKQPDLKTFFGTMTEPLMKGYVTEIVRDERIGMPVIFLYKDPDAPGGIRLITDSLGYEVHTCQVCREIRKSGVEKKELCHNSDRQAARDIIENYTDLAKVINVGGREYRRVEDTPVPHFEYTCTHIGLIEWAIPVLIDKICVGIFITGQFFTGTETDAMIKVRDIHRRYSDILKRFMSVKKKKRKDIFFFNRLFSKNAVEMTSLLSEPPHIDDERRVWLYKKVHEVEISLTKIYDDAFMNSETQIRKRLYNIVMGKKTPYTGVDELKTLGFNSLFHRFMFLRANLFDSSILAAKIYGLKEIGVYQPLTEPEELVSRHIIGTVLTGENEKQKDDALSFERSFFHTNKCLVLPDNWEEESESYKDSQFIQIARENEAVCDWMIFKKNWYEEFKLEGKITTCEVDCKFYKIGGDDYRCAFAHRRTAISNDKSLPCAAIKDEKNECPYLLCTPQPIDELKKRFTNCFLSVSATKSYKGYPVAFFVRYSELNEKRQKRYKDSLDSVIRYMSGAFLLQWNILIAEYNHLVNISMNKYRKHESSQILLGFAGLNNRITRNYKHTFTLLVAGNMLDKAISELGLYQHTFLSNQKIYMDRLSNIINTMDALTDDMSLENKRIDIYDSILIRMRNAYRYLEDAETRRLIFPSRTRGGVLPEIFADEMKLEQAINNLTNNAFKYSYPYSNVRLEKGQRHDEKLRNFICISVISYGPEIPEDERKKIFEMGYRIAGKDGTTNGKTGSGLGLFIARKFARLHDGDVVMEDSKWISDFNIPLLRILLESDLKVLPEELSRIADYKNLFDGYQKSGLYNEVVNTQYKFGEKMVELPSIGYYIGNLYKPTYRSTFTILLPLS